jgi:site-specific DNA recombinase
MIVAIYARKSTDQNGLDADARSVTRQVERSREYAAKRRWTVRDEHVYVDDGISGAEFVKRPGFRRLMDSLYPRPPFKALIMSEESRLGRDQIETTYALKQITDAGVRVFVYLDDREITLADATQTAMVQLRGFGAAMEREQASKRTYDALLRKAKSRQVTGGRVYGYTNVDVLGEADQDGRRKRLHVERKINDQQADVVGRIFQMYADGLGLKRIAKTLNAERISPPRRDARGWAPTAIREMLHREMYRGVIVWNRTQKVIRRGTKAQRRRAQDEWLRIDAPDLRIVSDEVWDAVHGRLHFAADWTTRRAGGAFKARPEQRDRDSSSLLVGFARCAVCGGSLGVETRAHGSGPSSARHRVRFYGCTYHRQRGPEVCPNANVLRTELLDDVVLGVVVETLDSDMIAEAIDLALEQLRSAQSERVDRRAQIERELSVCEDRLSRLVEALVRGGPMDTVVNQIKIEEARKRTLAEKLAGLRPREEVSPLDGTMIVRELNNTAVDVKALLAGTTAQARQMLRLILDGKKFSAEPIERDGRPGYRLSGELCIGRLLPTDVLRAVESAITSNKVVAPTGFEPVFESRREYALVRCGADEGKPHHLPSIQVAGDLVAVVDLQLRLHFGTDGHRGGASTAFTQVCP